MSKNLEQQERSGYCRDIREVHKSRAGISFQDRLQPWMAGAEPYRDVFTGVS